MNSEKDPALRSQFASWLGTDSCLAQGRWLKTLEGWTELLNPDSWYPKDGQPFFAILSQPYPDLPHEIQLGSRPEEVRVRQFDRIYVPPPHLTSSEQTAIIFDHLAQNYEAVEFIDFAFKDWLLNVLCSEIEIDKGNKKRVLDIGMGTGFSRRRISSDCLYGIDISPQMCSVSKNHGLRVVLADAEKGLPFPQTLFDGAILAFVAHWFKDERPFQEIRRVLKSGAKIGFNLYKPETDWQEKYDRILRGAGFTEINYFNPSFCSPSGHIYETYIVSARAESIK